MNKKTIIIAAVVILALIFWWTKTQKTSAPTNESGQTSVEGDSDVAELDLIGVGADTSADFTAVDGDMSQL